jgi:alpha-glucosidase
MLRLHQSLLRLRRERPALALGALTLLDLGGEILGYERRLGEDRVLIILNLGSEAQTVILPDDAFGARVLLSTLADPPPAARSPFLLRGDEGLAIDLGSCT